jgi:hypothetical protein
MGGGMGDRGWELVFGRGKAAERHFHIGRPFRHARQLKGFSLLTKDFFSFTRRITNVFRSSTGHSSSSPFSIRGGGWPLGTGAFRRVCNGLWINGYGQVLAMISGLAWPAGNFRGVGGGLV